MNPAAAKTRIKIWTDGGSRSNKPPFGIGYGSYRIGETGEIKSFEFWPMSANAAEIRIMGQAIKESGEVYINLYSDSRVGLKWVDDAMHTMNNIPEKISFEMKQSILFLRESCVGKDVKTHWRPRVQIFKIFNH